MYLITVILKTTPQMLQFHFNEHKEAKKIIDKYKTPSDVQNMHRNSQLAIDDSFGSMAVIEISEIAGMFLTDLSREMDAQADFKFAEQKMIGVVTKRLQMEPASRIMTPVNGLQS